MKTNKKNRAFSLVELSIVILIIGVLVAAVGQGLDLLQDSKLAAARSITKSSRVAALKDLGAWFDATAEQSFLLADIDSGELSTWKDINPQRGGIVTTSNSGLCGTKPTYVNNGINGLPAVKFGDTSLAQGVTPASCFNVSNANLLGTSGATIFFVATAGNNGDKQMPLSTGGAAITLYAPTTGSPGVVCGQAFKSPISDSWMSNYIPTNAPIIPRGTPFVCSARYEKSTEIQGWTNKLKAGNSSTFATNGGDLTQSNDAYIAGPGSHGGASTFTGQLGELIIFNRALTTKERNSVEDYLSRKWNIKFN